METELNAPDLLISFEQRMKEKSPNWLSRKDTGIPIPPCNYKPGEKLHILSDHEIENEMEEADIFIEEGN